MKKLSLLFINLFILGMFFLNPALTIAIEVDEAFEKGETLIPCGTETHIDPNTKAYTTLELEPGKFQTVKNPCTAEHFILMVNKLIEFVLIYLALPIITLILMFAGFKLLTSGGDTHARSEAKSMFFNALKGILFIAGSWLIVTSILTILGYTGSTILE